MKIKIILTIATIIALCCKTTFLFAQHCGGGGASHNHNNQSSNSESTYEKNYALNGGTVRQAGKYNIEMVFQPVFTKDPLTFYLMNKRGKPISNKGVTGKAELTFADGSTAIITLEPRGENELAGQMQDKSQSFTFLLTLQINGENVSIIFNGGTTGKEKIIYTCSMHSDVKSDKPGNCPKCGMTLEKVIN